MSRKEKYLSVVLGGGAKSPNVEAADGTVNYFEEDSKPAVCVSRMYLAGWVHSPNLRVGLLQCACLLLIDGVCFLIQTSAPQELGIEGQMTEVCI